jgi:hypothetical protein
MRRGESPFFLGSLAPKRKLLICAIFPQARQDAKTPSIPSAKEKSTPDTRDAFEKTISCTASNSKIKINI